MAEEKKILELEGLTAYHEKIKSTFATKEELSTRFKNLSGTLTEDEITTLYDLDDGRYLIISEEYGQEIIIINHEKQFFKRITGGYDYTYDFETQAWVVASGGGGGGGETPILTLIAESPLEQTVAAGSDYYIQYYFEPTRETVGTAKYYIDGVLKRTISISTGSNSFNVVDYITSGATTIEVVVTDRAGVSASLTYIITGIELEITSNFDETTVYSEEINFRYTPYGAIEKQVKFVIDGAEYGIDTVLTTGETISKTITGLTHGVHTLEVSMSATIDDTTISSNTLIYNIIFVESGNDAILISSKFNKTTATQGELLNIDYIVYDPVSSTSNVVLKVNGVEKGNLNVSRVRQYWNLTDYDVGALKLTITATSLSTGLIATKEFTLKVEEAEINVEPVTTNLELFLTAQGRSNNELEDTRSVWAYEDIQATLSNFNYSTNGWLQDNNGYNVLRLNGKAKVEIPFNIFGSNFLSLGKTIEFDFSTTDISDINNVLVTCFNNNKGFKITSNECVLKSEQTTVETKFKEDERVRVSFVIQSNGSYRLVKTFINGILSGLAQYPTNDDFMQSSPVGITINPNGGSIDIYSIRIYKQDLTDRQMLNNYIADLTLNEKIDAYTKNNILDDYGNVTYAKVKTLIPVLTITGSLPSWKGDKKTVKAMYEDPFDSNYNFEYSGVTLDIQGTSSQYFPRKNYKMKFPSKFSFYEGAVAEKTYTFKADYMESSHSHNTGNAKLMNSLSPQFPTQTESNGVRNAINGFPIVIFVKESDNADLVYYGVFNFNNDKGNSDTLGLTTSKAESWELKNNTSARCLFRSNDFINNVSDDFEARYPDEYTDYTALSRVVNWVYSTDGDIDTFKNEFESYFNKDFCLFYYVMMEMILAVDSRAKNMFLDTTDGVIWYPRWYDMDTAYGLNNEGVNQFSYGLEQHDSIDNVTVFNGENSLFWNNFEEAFADDIKAYYQNLRSTGKLTYDSILNILYGEQISKISEAMYNTDGQFKYVVPLAEDNDGTYLYVAQGSRINHLQWWLNNRFKYLDSKYQYADYMSDFISMRTYTPTEYVVEPIGTFEITPFTDMYVQILFGSSNVRARGKASEVLSIAAPEGLSFNNTETIIYGASRIIDVGDLSTKYARTMDFSKATKLKKLIIGNATEGYQNTNLQELSIGNNTMLELLDIRNCPNLTQAIDLSGCMNIKEVYAKGTSIVAVSLAEGGNLETLQLPSTITNLTLINQPFLKNLSIDSYEAITTLRIESCSKIDEKAILKLATNVERLRLTNINWDLYNEEQSILNNVMKLRGINESGASTEKAVLTGKVHIKGQVGTESMDKWNDYFGYDLEITADVVAQSYVVTFVDYDGTILDEVVVIEGETAVYGGKSLDGYYDDEGYEHTFIGWDKTLTNITSNMTTTALYKSNKPTIFTLNLTNESYLQPTVNTEGIAGTITIDWGDGNVETYTSTSYSGSRTSYLKSTAYSSTGVYTVKVLVDYTNLNSEITNRKIYLDYSSTYTYKQFIVDWEYQEGIYGCLDDYSFYKATGLTSITIPSGVKKIGLYAFQYCNNLKSVNLPSSLTTIESYVFCQCTTLEQISTEGVSWISNDAFTIPEGIMKVGDKAFRKIVYETYNEKSVIFPSTIASIGNGVFTRVYVSGYRSIKKAVINRLIPPWHSPSIVTNDYENDIMNCLIEVPIESYEDYKASSYWNTYTNMKGFGVGFYPLSDCVLLFNSQKNIVAEYVNTEGTENTITVVSSDESVATISDLVVNEDNFTFNVNSLSKEGTAIITMTLTVGDKVKVKEINASVYETIPEASYTVEAVDGASYGFALNDSGYYESSNKGVGNSASVCKVVINATGIHNMYLDCINSGESNYDFGILSNIDTTLTTTYGADSTNVFKSFKGSSLTSVQTVDYGVVEAGEHYIYVKFRKDSSGDSGNDSLQFQVRFEL